MSYPLLGMYPIVPAADLTSLTSAINAQKGSAIKSYDGATGKTAGQIVIRDAGSAVYSMVFSTGPAAADTWRVVDGSATYTPA